MVKYLATGGSGLLGKNMSALSSSIISPPSSLLNITQQSTINYYALADTYTSVLHQAAYTNVPGSEKDKRTATEVNIIGTKNIAEAFKNTRIVYISSDYVYAGQKGNYKETDKTAPFNFYGFTKLAGESYMDPAKDLIIRTSFKDVDNWKYDNAISDLYTSADSVQVISKIILKLLESDLTGIINVGTERKSIYDLIKTKHPDIVASTVTNVYNVSMPRDISMNIDILKAIIDGD